MKRLFSPPARAVKTQGFTLIELLVVMSIIAILAALVLSTYSYVQRSGATSRAKAEITAISTAAESFKVRYSEYPRTSATDSLSPSSTTPGAAYKTAGAYMTAFLCGSAALTREDQASGQYQEFKRWPIFLPIGEKTFSTDTVDITIPNLEAREGEPTTLTLKVRYLLDPFGNAYGYSTKGEMSSKDFFDLWSSAGTTSTTNSNKWITNW